MLRADGLDAGGAVDELLAFTGGHPQRTVLLAHHVYNLLDHPGQPEDLATAATDLVLADERNFRRDDQNRPFVLDPLFGEWLRRR